MTNLLKVIIILLMIGLVTGCASENNEDISKNTKQNNIVDNAASVSQKTEQFIITDSNSIKGWKKLSAKVMLNEMTFYDDRQGSEEIEGNRTVEYIIQFPSCWTLNGTVFQDEQNNKIAELAPVVLFKQGEEAVYLDYKIHPSGDSTQNILSKEKIVFDGYKGTKIVLKVDNGYVV